MSDSILNIASSGLLAFQKSINTTAHNIVNAGTPGYSRQVTDLGTAEPRIVGGNYIGNGVNVLGVRQVIDNLAKGILRGNIASENQASNLLDYADRISGIISDADTGLAAGLNGFYSALSDLAAEPDSIERRDVFLQRSTVLVNSFTDLDNRLSLETANANQDINLSLGKINDLTSSVASLNASIMSSIGSNGVSNANDLLDKREVALQELASLVNVNTFSPGDGSLTVFAKSGQTLVIGGSSTQIKSQLNPLDPNQLDLIVKPNLDSPSQIITSALNGGQLGGLKTVQSTLINPIRNQLSVIALTLAGAFNDQHHLGIDLEGKAGLNFFNDVNAEALVSGRVLPLANNIGQASIIAKLNPTIRPNDFGSQIFGQAGTLQNQSSLPSLRTNNLIINQVPIRAAEASDDLSSPGPGLDNLASAKASASAINSSQALHGVSAKAGPNLLSLGQLTINTGLNNQFRINDQLINFAATADTETIVDTINQYTETTGVAVSIDDNQQYLLTAIDGRNIKLDYLGTPGGSTFSHFDMSGSVAVNKVQRAPLILQCESGQIEIAGNSPEDIGLSPGIVPSNANNLTASTYSLTYNGSNYQLRRDQDQVLVAQASQFDASHPLVADGFTLQNTGGAMQIGDAFSINPTRGGAVNMGISLTETKAIALAAPIVTRSNDLNAGTGSISVGRVTANNVPDNSSQFGNAFLAPKKLSPPLKISFIDEAHFQIYDMSTGEPGQAFGPIQDYVPGAEIFPVAGFLNSSDPTLANRVFDPSYRVTLSGSPKMDDSFNIDFNQTGINDNRNALALLELQGEALLNNGTASIEQTYGQLVSSTGALAERTQTAVEEAKALTQSARDRADEISGVNIEEESANLIRLQQIYQAIAKIMKAQNEMFDSLLSIFR